MVSRAKAGRAIVMQTVGSAQEAQAAVRYGVDVVVAQGWEAGGHVWGTVATMALVPAVVDAVSPVPVAVGFGIKDADSARAVASVADGVVVGSALVDAMARAIEGGGDHEAAMAAAVALLAEIRRGIDHAAS